MVPISLLLWITLEVAIYLAVARLGLKADWAYAGAGAIGGVLGMRAGIVAITWMFGMAFASPAPRLGTARTARLMVVEYAAFLFTFIIVLPLERLWMPADRPHPGRLPILLVHGYGCSQGVWWLLRRRLEAAGLIEAADAALAAQPFLFRRFYTAGTIPHDDPDAIAFLQGIGADPVTVLAPE